jgi:hypothetical protein
VQEFLRRFDAGLMDAHLTEELRKLSDEQLYELGNILMAREEARPNAISV